MTPQEQAEGAKLLAAACERWDSQPMLRFGIARIDVYAIVLALQTVQTHPAFPPSMKQALEKIGRLFVDQIGDDPQVHAFLTLGWDRNKDVDKDGNPFNQDQVNR